MNKLLDDGYSLTTLKHSKYLLNGCFKYALSKQDIKANSVDFITLPSKDNFNKKEIVFLTEEDIPKFIAVATQTYPSGEAVYRYGYGLVFILFTGLRLGEALALKWSDINFSTRTVQVNSNIVIVKNRQKETEQDSNYTTKVIKPKTSTGIREVYLSQTALDAITSLTKRVDEDMVSEIITKLTDRLIRFKIIEDICDERN